MADDELDQSLAMQAAVLAEQTFQAPLEQLAQLCPAAERVIEDLLEVKEPGQDVLQLLGLRDQRELRAFVERVILAGSASPQDLLAKYLYQGQAARKAGVDPRLWIFQVHRPMRVALLKYLHCREQNIDAGTIPRVYGLDLPAIQEELDKAIADFQADDAGEDPFQGHIEMRLRHLRQLEKVFRKGAAMRLMADQLQRLKENAGQPGAASGTTTSRPGKSSGSKAAGDIAPMVSTISARIR